MKRFVKSVGWLVMILCLLAQPIMGSALENSMVKPSGLYVYVIPSGEDHEKKTDKDESNQPIKGNFWFYVEMIGDKNNPYVEDGWDVELELYHYESEKSYSLTECQVSSQGTGYVFANETIVGNNEYKDYKITVTISDGDTVVGETSGVMADLIVNWPVLKEDTWEETWEVSEDEKENTRVIDFEWVDESLFSRVFSVSVNKTSKDLQFVKENGFYKLILSQCVQEDIKVVLSDEAGNEASYLYKINVTPEEKSSFGWILGLLVVVILFVVGFVVIKKGKPEDPNGGDKRELTLLGEHGKRLRDENASLNSAKESYEKKKKAYKELLKRERETWESLAGDVNYADDLTQLEQVGTDSWIEKYNKCHEKYLEALKSIQGYNDPKSYEKWRKEKEVRSKEYMEVELDLSTLRNELITIAIKGIDEKMGKLSTLVQEQKRKQEILGTPLGMDLYMKIYKGTEIYTVNVDQYGLGFVLHEKKALDKTMRLTKDSLGTLFGGENMGIRISACEEKDCVLLVCMGQTLYHGNEIVREQKIHMDEIWEFRYCFADGSEATICIDTN